MRIHYFLSAILFVLIFVSCDQCSLINNPVAEYQTGDTIWIHESPVKDSMYINSSLAIGSDGSIYYAASGGTLTWHPVQLFALNRDDGSLKWITEKMDANGLSSQIVVGDDGTIYAIG